MIRNILSAFLGLAAGIFIIFSLEICSHIIHPMPPGLDLNDMEALKVYTSSAPLVVFILLIVSYGSASLVGGLVAAAVASANKMTQAITVGGILMGLGAYNLFMIPHPVWTIIISIFLFIPCSYLGGYLGIKMSGPKKATSK
ncbi:MAG TPA: hypothetical protein VF868_06870 [Bacteroidia bacterium]|jgi:hypothetical protein